MSKRPGFKVAWSVKDQEYVARCDDYPSLSFPSETPEAALRGLTLAIRATEELTKSHERWDNISWDGSSVIGYDVGRCSCQSPWRHWP